MLCGLGMQIYIDRSRKTLEWCYYSDYEETVKRATF
jgi:hypothetical protein